MSVSSSTTNSSIISSISRLFSQLILSIRVQTIPESSSSPSSSSSFWDSSRIFFITNTNTLYQQYSFQTFGVVLQDLFGSDDAYCHFCLRQPSPVNRAIMKVVLQTIYNSILSCCWCCCWCGTKDGWRSSSDNDTTTTTTTTSSAGAGTGTGTRTATTRRRLDAEDGEEGYCSGDEEEEARLLLQTSMKDRIQDYENAMAKTESAILGSAPTPYKRERSTSHVIEQFESMATTSLSTASTHSQSSSACSGQQRRRRRPTTTTGRRTPLMEQSSTTNHDNNIMKDDSSSSASSFLRKKSALQASIHNQVKNYPSCAACWETIYPRDVTIQSYGRTLHAACFVCRLCHAKLKHHPMEVQLELPAGGKDKAGSLSSSSSSPSSSVFLYCVCAKCQLDSMHRDTPKVLATVAGEKIAVEDEEWGDVQGVKDAIGDELEEILLEKTVPRCQVCSGDFLNYNTDSGRVCIIGQMKYHQECWETGKPSVDLADRQLIPYQAAKYLPDRWIVRLLLLDTTNGMDGKDKDKEKRTTTTTTTTTSPRSSSRQPLTTLFFCWTTRLADFQRFLATRQVHADSTVQIELELDDQAMGNPNYREDPTKRKTQASLVLPPTSSISSSSSSSSSSSPLVHCELVGNPLSAALVQTTTTTTTQESSGRGGFFWRTFHNDLLQLQLQGNKYRVQHTMTLTIPKLDATTLDLSGVRLTITLCRQQEP